MLFCTARGRIKRVAPHGASIRMPPNETDSVARTPKEPTPKQVLREMSLCEPYTVSDLADAFSDASRWTVQRRLDSLVEDGELSKKKHTKNRVSYWIPK
jgi:predicted HTH transcriptional regulator